VLDEIPDEAVVLLDVEHMQLVHLSLYRVFMLPTLLGLLIHGSGEIRLPLILMRLHQVGFVEDIDHGLHQYGDEEAEEHDGHGVDSKGFDGHDFAETGEGGVEHRLDCLSEAVGDPLDHISFESLDPKGILPLLVEDEDVVASNSNDDDDCGNVDRGEVADSVDVEVDEGGGGDAHGDVDQTDQPQSDALLVQHHVEQTGHDHQQHEDHVSLDEDIGFFLTELLTQSHHLEVGRVKGLRFLKGIFGELDSHLSQFLIVDGLVYHLSPHSWLHLLHCRFIGFSGYSQHGHDEPGLGAFLREGPLKELSGF
jgi:hypothetical protein